MKGGIIIPYYDYKCIHCGIIEEKQFKIEELEDEIQCDNCGGTAKRFYSPIRTLYKCTGFYSTDNKNEGDTY